MKLPIKQTETTPSPAKALQFEIDEVDAFGGATHNGEIYVKECRTGAIVKKSQAMPYRRKMVGKDVVYFYLRKGDSPPIDFDSMVPSTWNPK